MGVIWRWAGWYDFVNMPHRSLPCTSCTLESFVSKIFASFQSIRWFSSNEYCASLDLSRWPTPKFFAVFPETRGPLYACFPNVAPATFVGNIIETIRSLLCSTYWSSSHKWVSQAVPRFENSFNIICVRYTFEDSFITCIINPVG